MAPEAISTVALIFYGLLVGLWGAILAIYLSHLRHRRMLGGLIAMLLGVLALDAFRTLLESAYFGAFFSARFGLLPAGVHETLSHPGLLLVPKVVNLAAAVAVLGILLRYWLPSTLAARRRAEQALHEAERQYRELVDNMVEGVYRVTPDGRLTMANPSLARLLGYDSPEALVHGLASPERPFRVDRERVARMFEQCRREGEVRDFEFVLQRDGVPLFVTATARAVHDAAGRLLHIEGSVTDVTERRLAEHRREESEERFRSLVENTLLGVLIQREERPVFANRAFAAMFGYDGPEAVLALENEAALYAPHERERLGGYTRARYRGEPAPERYEFQGLRRDGTPVWVENNVRLVHWNGEPVIQALAVDITERKRAEEERARLAAAVEQAGDIVLITDIEARLQYVNPAFEALTGFTRREVLGRTPGALKLGSREAFEAEVLPRLRRGETWKGRCINRRRDGTRFETETTYSPIRDSAGNVTYYVAVKKDVSRQVRLEEQLRRAQRLEALGTLSGGIAHDFNNILVPILGYTELLLRDYPETADRTHVYLERIARAAQRASDLVAQILLFSRQGGSRREALHTEAIVREVVRLLQSTLPKSVAVVEDMPTEVRAVFADGTQLHQLVMNLCVNAGQAMPEGGTLRVGLADRVLDAQECFLGGTLSGPHVEITVSDTGVGIPAHELTRIFEPFFTTKEVGQGTGLGLSTVIGILQQHDGGLLVDSRPGAGTTFRVFLPAAHADEAAAREDEPAAAGSEAVLLIDDEPPVTHLGRLTLERLGYHVTAYTDAPAALADFRARPHAFDVVVTDHSMPGISGTQMLCELRRVCADVPIVLCTGYSDHVTPESAREQGVDAFVYKPFSGDVLGRAVRRALARGGSRRDPPTAPAP